MEERLQEMDLGNHVGLDPFDPSLDGPFAFAFNFRLLFLNIARVRGVQGLAIGIVLAVDILSAAFESLKEYGQKKADDHRSNKSAHGVDAPCVKQNDLAHASVEKHGHLMT